MDGPTDAPNGQAALTMVYAGANPDCNRFHNHSGSWLGSRRPIPHTQECAAR